MNTASQNLPRHLDILRERLLHPTDYEKAFHYFLEEFGGDADFIAMGEVEAAPLIVAVLSHIASKSLGKPVRVEGARLSLVRDHRFHHGSAAVDGRALVFFYFEDSNKGLVTIIPGADGGAGMARFSLPQNLPVNPAHN
ncbi:MAG: hypothetical protein K1X78_00030 [Verrucomicrobiaceae bacterium]|nr:hypothetical protein [Verrucomicrobiaceae bacterium]